MKHLCRRINFPEYYSLVLSCGYLDRLPMPQLLRAAIGLPEQSMSNWAGASVLTNVEGNILDLLLCWHLHASKARD